MNRYFKYLLLATFIIAILFIVFLQFNSNRNINKLIEGNENLLTHFEVKANLQRIQTNILALESKVKSSVIDDTILEAHYLNAEIKSVNAVLTTIDSLPVVSSAIPYISKLNSLVKEKISFNQAIIESFKTNGKAEAERIINTQRGKQITDSIKIICAEVEKSHQDAVVSLIENADLNGKKAKTLGSIMAAIAILASIFTFVYVAQKVTQQQLLIHRLNISERKSKEAVQVKENFLANMSHEIRTPLNAIIGFTNILQRKQLDEESRNYVKVIKSSGENLLTIVNDVLDLSKIEAGMMRIESAPFSIRELIHSVETMLKSRAAEKKLQLTATVSNDMPDELEGDATRLAQILINLIGNSIKFTDNGTISIIVNKAGMDNDVVNTSITVTDTGIGIAKEKLHLIFERFQQAEDATTRKYGGTGLGLSIVKELVYLQGGSISADSEPGKGTTFKIILPYKKSSGQIASVDTLSNAAIQNTFRPHDLGNIKILVAEDNEINQSLLKHLFKEWDISYDIVNNGQEAITLLEKHTYDIILMDVQMPVMDGGTAAQIIRQTLKLNTPIIVMTAHAMPGEKEKYLSYGMNEYISKPIKENRLYELIAQLTHTNISKSSVSISSGATEIVSPYNVIDLTYMKEISMGDTEYEKAVTEQFIEIIPENLNDILQNWKAGNISAMKQAAHNMKTSVSIMGLTDKLLSSLDALENEQLTEITFEQNYSQLEKICLDALREAGQLLQTLSK